MPKFGFLVAGVALAANAVAQTSTSSETEVALIVAACNGVVESTKRESIRACEALEKDNRLALVDPAAVIAYRQYQEERLQACKNRNSLPRGMSRRQSSCTP